MRRWLRVFGVTTVLAVILGLSFGVSAAHAEDEPSGQWAVSKYHAAVDLTESGAANVTLELDFDFGSEAGHGPYIYLPIRQETADPEQWLDLGVELTSVTSPSRCEC